MPQAAKSNWSINIGNESRTSERVSSKTGAHGTYNSYDNRPLLPYVGQSGWLIEQPEYDLKGRSIDSWHSTGVPFAVLYKCLKRDTGMYRVRFTMPEHLEFRRAIYSNARTCGQDFEWSHDALLPVLKATKTRWKIEVYEEADKENRGHWLTVKDPDWSPCDLYRLVEA